MRFCLEYIIKWGQYRFPSKNTTQNRNVYTLRFEFVKAKATECGAGSLSLRNVPLNEFVETSLELKEGGPYK